MAENAILSSLKIDLGISSDAYDSRLTEYINAAKKAISEQGVTIDESDIEDIQLIIMYAAWTWRKRDSGEGMPRMLRYALNCRVLAEKARESDA